MTLASLVCAGRRAHQPVMPADDHNPRGHSNAFLHAPAAQPVGDRRKRDPRHRRNADRHRKRPHRRDAGRAAAMARIALRKTLHHVLAHTAYWHLGGGARYELAVPPSTAHEIPATPDGPAVAVAVTYCVPAVEGASAAQLEATVGSGYRSRSSWCSSQARRPRPIPRSSAASLPAVVDRVDRLRDRRGAALVPSRDSRPDVEDATIWPLIVAPRPHTPEGESP